MGERLRRAAPIVAVAAAVIIVLAAWWLGGAKPTEPERMANVGVAEPAAPAVEPEPGAAGELQPAAPPIPALEPQAQEGEAEETSSESDAEQDAIAAAWANVDLDAVRRAMPDNVYFKLSAPTQDEAVQEERRKERDRWNTEYGKILAGTGTDAEIRAYYDQRAKLSTDYVEFATYLLDHYRDTLNPRDVSMLELARTLNAARLEEIPRKVEEAFERKRQQDEARAAWLAGEAEFAGEDTR